MGRRVDRVEESETMLRVLRKNSDWPRSARQLGQRIPEITKLGTLHRLPRTIYTKADRG
jgi:hypothetical protein